MKQDYLADLNTDERIIFKGIFKKLSVKVWN
jgi:hypothetical protein